MFEVYSYTRQEHRDTALPQTIPVYSVFVDLTHVVCRIIHPKIEGACVHYDVITSYDVC